MTYEYKCTHCNHIWNLEQRIVEEPIKLCPVCHQLTAKRQICATAFILKGGGWYADGYTSKSNLTSK